jgi:hypothetical protein
MKTRVRIDEGSQLLLLLLLLLLQVLVPLLLLSPLHPALLLGRGESWELLLPSWAMQPSSQVRTFGGGGG